MGKWVIITGAGTGIGAGLARHLAKIGLNVLAVGRRQNKVCEVANDFPGVIFPLSTDIGTDEGVDKIYESIPKGDELLYLVQNAAVGVPGRLGEIKRGEFEYAMAVNVTAPLMLTQKLLPLLRQSKGRILHIGTNIAFNAQVGTSTYGITKMAFYRLYQQLKVDLEGTGVSVASVHPGVVDTEGLWEHAQLAHAAELPHAAYFDRLKEEGGMLDPTHVAKFLRFLLQDTNNEEYSAKEWHIKDETHWKRWKE